MAAAAVYYHRFYAEVDQCEYDEFVSHAAISVPPLPCTQCYCFQLIAASTLYLATKVKDEPVKIRDLVSVVHCTLNRTVEAPENDPDFWLIRDAIVQAELLITRMLKFEMNTTVHPHKVS